MRPEHTQFLLGAATAAHQVEGANIHSDFWAMEQMKYSDFKEPSGNAVDHYHRYEEDIRMMQEAGLNAYRFSIEWARIEPQKGRYDWEEVEHYRKVLDCCKACGITPFVTLHHFSSPKWLIEEGGWEAEQTIERFTEYALFVVEQYRDALEYVCTLNEANMGLMMSMVKRSAASRQQAKLQVGMNLDAAREEFRQRQKEEYKRIFGTERPACFMGELSEQSDIIIMKAHCSARDAIKAKFPDIKVGVTFSVHDFEAVEGGEAFAAREWEAEFGHYIPYIKDDDFVGLQNYTRQLVGPEGFLPVPEGALRTQVGYECYPKAVGNVVRKAAAVLRVPVFVTENGVALEDDSKRVAFIETALDEIKKCREDGIDIRGYMYWSLLDNFEWQKGYAQTFGLIAVDRTSQRRTAKPSLKALGEGLLRFSN